MNLFRARDRENHGSLRQDDDEPLLFLDIGIRGDYTFGYGNHPSHASIDVRMRGSHAGTQALPKGSYDRGNYRSPGYFA